MKSILLLLTILTFDLSATDFAGYINHKNCDKIIDKQVFTICYDYRMKGAKYVAYTLSGSKVNAVNIKKRSSFYTEKNLKKQYRSQTKDYTHTGYDRGHLANDASFDYNKNVLRKTYTMANIIPQAPVVNRKTWIKAEKLERKVAVSLGTVNIINGVIYSSSPKRIGENRVAVPDAFWKMIYNDSKNYKKCFYYKNDLKAEVKGDKLKDHLVDCSTMD